MVPFDPTRDMRGDSDHIRQLHAGIGFHVAERGRAEGTDVGMEDEQEVVAEYLADQLGLSRPVPRSSLAVGNLRQDKHGHQQVSELENNR